MEQVKESRVGETSVLECLVSGSPPPELRWLKDSLPLEETVRHFLAADAQLLVIVDTVPPDAGTYTCEVTNAVGTRRGVTHLSVLPVGDQVQEVGSYCSYVAQCVLSFCIAIHCPDVPHYLEEGHCRCGYYRDAVALCSLGVRASFAW